jgi:hypothetical protein
MPIANLDNSWKWCLPKLLSLECSWNQITSQWTYHDLSTKNICHQMSCYCYFCSTILVIPFRDGWKLIKFDEWKIVIN